MLAFSPTVENQLLKTAVVLALASDPNYCRVETKKGYLPKLLSTPFRAQVITFAPREPVVRDAVIMPSAHCTFMLSETDNSDSLISSLYALVVAPKGSLLQNSDYPIGL